MHPKFHELSRDIGYEITNSLGQASYLLPFTDRDICEKLQRTACRVRRKEGLSQSEVLSTFFTEEAAQYLLTFPNIHWLWRAVTASLRWTAPADIISLEAMHKGVHDLMLPMGKFDLHLTLGEMTAAQIASRVGRGVILIKTNRFDTDEILFNPLFSPEAAQACNM